MERWRSRRFARWRPDHEDGTCDAHESIAMFSTIWNVVAVGLTALLMGSTFGHVLEMPAKLRLDGTSWMTLQQNLYRTFASIGGIVEIGAILTTVILVVLVRGSHRELCLTLTAALILAGGFFLVWLVFTNPVNAEVFRWRAGSIPADWTRWRTQWELSHLVRFGLHLGAFILLVLSLVAHARRT
jgi:hypothetical protein